jgi:hypothetical protein
VSYQTRKRRKACRVLKGKSAGLWPFGKAGKEVQLIIWST